MEHSVGVDSVDNSLLVTENKTILLKGALLSVTEPERS